MPQLPWQTLIAQHPHTHLVIGVVAGGTVASATKLLGGWLQRLALKGDWAVLEGQDGNVVYSAFEGEDDANRACKAVLARTEGRYPGSWASQRSFHLDSVVRRALSASLRGEPEVPME